MTALPTRLHQPQVQTDFLSASDAARLVVRVGVLECLRQMVVALQADYARWNDFDKTARTAAHSASGVIELMPVADDQDYAFKYVNGHPINTQYGLPTVMAFGALADVATGAPRFVSELTLTTALRTAATSAMAALKLARPDSRCMALIGNGAQSEFQALAFIDLLGVRRLQLFDVDRAASEKLQRNLAPWVTELGVEIHIAGSVQAAVQGADIVTTVTADKRNAVVLDASVLAPGMHLNAVGGDCPGKTELSAEVLERSSVFVEYEPQTRLEGELQQMPADFAVTELWRVLAGQAAGRVSDQQITLFDSVGFALEDYSALRTMHALGREAGLLSRIELVPTLADPKDLFALLKAQAAADQAASAWKQVA
ncbi:MAG: ornithine cyclodeaminase [Acidovorax sp.]|jgi:ornithine cyclodeaminase|nr:ornithine cyclodeaminase [Acidovorax sp.]